MTTEYAIRRTGKASDSVSRGGEQVATIRSEAGRPFTLESTKEGSWKLDPRVHGEIRPFSMSVSLVGGTGVAILTIRNHLFFHGAKAYLLGGIPQDAHPGDHILGERHINRLDKFPFSGLEDVDPETWGRLKRHRGTPVGTMGGLGQDEFRVKISDELDDIGLPLSAAAYLLYSAA